MGALSAQHALVTPPAPALLMDGPEIQDHCRRRLGSLSQHRVRWTCSRGATSPNSRDPWPLGSPGKQHPLLAGPHFSAFPSLEPEDVRSLPGPHSAFGAAGHATACARDRRFLQEYTNDPAVPLQGPQGISTRVHQVSLVRVCTAHAGVGGPPEAYSRWVSHMEGVCAGQTGPQTAALGNLKTKRQ